MRISDWSSDVCSSDLDDWNAILDHLRLDDAIKRHAAGVLKAFGEQQLPRLADRLRALEADADIVEACEPGIEHQMRALREIGHADQATRSEERRVGKECGSTCRSRWAAYQ